MRDVDDVSGLEPDIFGFVSLDKEVIKIEIRDGSPVASNLNVPQRSLRCRSPRRENGIHQRAQRSDGIGSGISRVPHDNDLNGTQSAQAHCKVEILEYLRNLVLQVLLEVAIADSGHGNLANLRNINLPRAIYINP